LVARPMGTHWSRGRPYSGPGEGASPVWAHPWAFPASPYGVRDAPSAGPSKPRSYRPHTSSGSITAAPGPTAVCLDGFPDWRWRHSRPVRENTRTRSPSRWQMKRERHMTLTMKQKPSCLIS
jgi:hypothetical protein